MSMVSMSGGWNMFGSPVDFSFRELNTVSDMLSDEPNPGARPLKRDSEQKILSSTLRLNNNFLSDLTGLMDTLSALYAEPTRLAWLDLSFNEFQHIHPVLTQLKELRLLYLHGNRVCKLSEVDKLAALPFLHTITLHGNPIVTERDYRAHLISTLPHVKMIDFSAVTKQERELTSVWQRRRNPLKTMSHSKVD
ncbi:leucine-rich repeat-containing protein 51-like isoform X1 [Carassius auratus]|uniref:Leucine-rich repeat-containing protein 51 n=2 Tax=Carassius auratus TaxID=7957 RepID=A0A6P6NJF3_CARAU|nr:leucine-rich repeat-containing protein 51-like isoform X1 [Carassius auratus]